ncbi:hypothetical protein L1987_45088 [Smallanthus sonchifolius]|uniref:Uncharacterized protein n=1 Tax=Smallanthus sonchifolius TaxID=185202 RepID=A0ACB9GRA4_9ASTR|nr:hypothetical protein L1987_45088 [Smallanthus sonchifolius]
MDEDGIKRRKEGGFGDLIWRPVNWFKMLSDELTWRFVCAVVIVYGINQGLSIGLYRVSVQYYMKDVLKLQPSEAQFYSGIIQIPWIIKPLWGLLTDIVPIFRLRRRPYFIFAGLVGSMAMLIPAFSTNLPQICAVLSFMTAGAGVAIADVTIDALVTENSISHPSLAGDMQSLCGVSSSIGQLVGFALSGVLVHIIGPQGVFGVLSIPAGLVILVGMMLQEHRVHSYSHERVSQQFTDAIKTMAKALKTPDVWRPCLYMYLSLALGVSIHEGMFYWYTDAKAGPSFSQEVIGSIFSVGAIGSLLGVLLYQNVFRSHPFRGVLFWSQLLYGASSLLDLLLVLRLNLNFGVPDYMFAVMDEGVSKMIARLRWMPLLVLSSKLCPSGIEGTFFALLMSIDHIGTLTSSWAGSVLLHALNVTRTHFDNLWAVILIRTFARLLPIGLLFLVPSNDPNSTILPSELLMTKKGDDVLESGNSEMISLVNNSI